MTKIGTKTEKSPLEKNKPEIKNPLTEDEQEVVNALFNLMKAVIARYNANEQLDESLNALDAIMRKSKLKIHNSIGDLEYFIDHSMINPNVSSYLNFLGETFGSKILYAALGLIRLENNKQK